MSPVTVPERVFAPQVTAPVLPASRSVHAEGHSRRGLIEEAVSAALDCREALGIAHQPPLPEDAWLLLEALGDAVMLERSTAVHSSSICYLRNRPDRVTLAACESVWKEAEVLAHEIGHHLLTQPTEADHALSSADFYSVGRRDPVELIAIAFASGFMYPVL